MGVFKGQLISKCLQFSQKNEQKNSTVLKVSKSRKQFIVSSILPKTKRWYNSMYWKLSQRLFFGRIEDTIICFRDCLTFTWPQVESLSFIFWENWRHKKDVSKLTDLYLWRKMFLCVNFFVIHDLAAWISWEKKLLLKFPWLFFFFC